MSKARDHYLALREKHGPMLPRSRKFVGSDCWYSRRNDGVYLLNIPATAIEALSLIDAGAQARRDAVTQAQSDAQARFHRDSLGIFQVNPNPWQREAPPLRWRHLGRWFRAH